MKYSNIVHLKLPLLPLQRASMAQLICGHSHSVKHNVFYCVILCSGISNRPCISLSSSAAVVFWWKNLTVAPHFYMMESRTVSALMTSLATKLSLHEERVSRLFLTDETILAALSVTTASTLLVMPQSSDNFVRSDILSATDCKPASASFDQ